MDVLYKYLLFYRKLPEMGGKCWQIIALMAT